jgi:PA14 domain
VSTPAANTTYTATYRVSTGAGTGLSATYFNNMDFTGTTVSRVDPTVDFVWGSATPAATIGADTFSVRWTGQAQPQFSETYTFYTQSDDGVRLWVNGQQIVNNWTNHSTVENSGTIALAAGQRYDIRMEFFENTGDATARLLWSSPSVAEAVIPSSRLFPSAGTSRRSGSTSSRRARRSQPDTWPTGDALYFDSVFRVTVEGVLTVSGTPTGATRWIEGTSNVTVTDGRLTIRSGSGASNNKICFVEISQ